MEVEKYLSRINYKSKVRLNEECLRELHRCHIFSIPFEGLDVQINRRIVLDIQSIYEKVVLNNRGGFCYELNYLFHTLISKLGFKSALLSSRIYDDDGRIGPEYDHMSLIVRLDCDWLLDVGYGDLFIEPLKIHEESNQEDEFKIYQIQPLEEHRFLLLESLKDEALFQKRYEFDERPKKIEDFQDQCYAKQYSPDSYFVKNRVCTMPFPAGRKTLFNDKFSKRVGERKVEEVVADEGTFRAVLEKEFGMKL